MKPPTITCFESMPEAYMTLNLTGFIVIIILLILIFVDSVPSTGKSLYMIKYDVMPSTDYVKKYREKYDNGHWF